MVTNLAMALEPIEISEAPIKWCSVSLSEIIAKGTRLEASVFGVEGKRAYEIINNCKYGCINLIGENAPVYMAHYGARLKRNYTKQEKANTIGFIGSSEMLDIQPKPTKFMVDDVRVTNLHVTKGTVLISRSGTIGNLSFVNRTLEKLLISEHAMRLECKEYSGYVYAYLKTSVGQSLIKSNIYGAVIQQIEPEHLTTIPIPDAPSEMKEKIHNLIVKSYDLRDESNDLINQATALLVDELKLPPIQDLMCKVTKGNAPIEAFSAKLSEMEGRVDASYHVPVVGAITRHLKEYAKEVTCVGDKRISQDVILPGRFKRTYVDKEDGKVFIGGKQLHELDPSGKKYLSLSKHTARIEKELEIEENTILITRSGTIGKVAMVPQHWQHWVVSEHVIRIVPASRDIAGYLSIFLSSEYGYELIKRFTYGSVVDEIDDAHVRQIAIPLLSDPVVQKKINDFALEANVKRYEAYQLEQQALQIMNHDVIYAK